MKVSFDIAAVAMAAQVPHLFLCRICP